MENMSKRAGISGSTLKIIAVISMLIDHTAATILERMMYLAPEGRFPFVDAHWQGFSALYFAMRTIGRFAFPLYCYLLVEGFVHTRNVAKYAGRLLLFALISEVPFDLAFRRSVWDMSYNNVFFTLFLGLVAIAFIKFTEEHMVSKDSAGGKNIALLLIRCILDMAVAFGLMAIAADVLCTDYGAAGVAAIVLLYLMKDHPKMAFALTVIWLGITCGEIEFAAMLMLIPVALYDGTRGKQMKYFFYLFYPVHLLILVGICWLLGLA